MDGDLTWPVDLAPYKVAFYPQANTSRATSPLTKVQKAYVLTAPLWVARFTFRAGYDGGVSDGAQGFGPRLESLILQMDGGANRVKLWDWRRPRPNRPQFSRVASGLTNVGAAAGATSMEIAGFSPSAVAFSIGDYVGGDQRPHIVSARSYAGPDGVATVTFNPPLVAPVVAGSPAVVSMVPGWFRLTSDDAGANETEVGQPTEFALDFLEDLWW